MADPRAVDPVLVNLLFFIAQSARRLRNGSVTVRRYNIQEEFSPAHKGSLIDHFNAFEELSAEFDAIIQVLSRFNLPELAPGLASLKNLSVATKKEILVGRSRLGKSTARSWVQKSAVRLIATMSSELADLEVMARQLLSDHFRGKSE
jgi:hypothetical protein